VKRTLISCSIFEAELKEVLKNSPWETEIIWLPAGLHSDLDLLEQKLIPLLEENKPLGRQLRLLIGSGCLPNMKELAGSFGIQLPKAKNCLEALLGSDRLRELEQNRTLVITPAWIRKVFMTLEGVSSVLRWDSTDFRINFGRYDRLLVLEAGLEPLSIEETLDFFEMAQVPIETLEINLDRFREAINELLD
jgi:hypothetical protein